MTVQDRQRWDKVYRERAEDDYPPPDPLLFEYTPPINDEEEHRALDLACGLGQNGLWLAAQGYTVDLLDISRVALLRAQDEMGRRKLHNANLYQVDLDAHTLPTDTYEIICVFRYLKRDFFTQLRHAVRPGGRIVYETFNQRYLETVPAFNPAFLLEVGELAGYFADWKVLYNLEGKQVSSLVAIKPAV